MTTIEERLNEQLSEAEEKIEELETQIENSKYEEEWNWRHLRELSEEDNLGLPVPRLEIRHRKKGRYGTIVDYGLVHEHLLGHLEFVPFGSTRISGTLSDFELPHRDGSHIKYDMYTLKLPGYVVSNGESKEITLNDRRDLPAALIRKMESKPPKLIKEEECEKDLKGVGI